MRLLCRLKREKLYYISPKTFESGKNWLPEEQNAEGKGQEAQGQLNDLGSGIANRVSGTVGGIVAGVTGDRQAQIDAEQKHDVGKVSLSLYEPLV